MQPLRNLVLSLTAIGLLGTGAASAQEFSGPDITGAWTFETGPYNSTCKIHGRIFIHPREDDGIRTCEFVAYEDCPDLSAEVRQSCKLRQSGDQVMITSKIESIERQDPIRYSYAPDDWMLIIQSDQEMTGTLESASRANAVFKRENVPIS